MSLVTDIKEVVTNRHPSLRAGQAAFNRLYELLPEWADSIRSGPLDPFHRDEQLDEFYAFIIREIEVKP